MVRGFRASRGNGVRGKEAAADGGLRRCFACDRPGSRDGCSTRWQHVGDSETWALLGEWSASVGSGWRHDRDLQQNPLRVGASPSGTRGTGRQGTRLLWCRPRRSLHRPEFTRSPCCNKRHDPDIGRRYAPGRRHRRVCQGVRRGKGVSGLGRDEPALQARLRNFEAGGAGRGYGSGLQAEVDFSGAHQNQRAVAKGKCA